MGGGTRALMEMPSNFNPIEMPNQISTLRRDSFSSNVHVHCKVFQLSYHRDFSSSFLNLAVTNLKCLFNTDGRSVRVLTLETNIIGFARFLHVCLLLPCQEGE